MDEIGIIIFFSYSVFTCVDWNIGKKSEIFSLFFTLEFFYDNIVNCLFKVKRKPSYLFCRFFCFTTLGLPFHN